MNAAEMFLSGRIYNDEDIRVSVDEIPVLTDMVAESPRIDVQNIVDSFTPDTTWFPKVPVVPPWPRCTLFFRLHRMKCVLLTHADRVNTPPGRERVLDYMMSRAHEFKLESYPCDVENALAEWKSGFAICTLAYACMIEDPGLHLIGFLYDFLHEDGFPAIHPGISLVNSNLFIGNLGFSNEEFAQAFAWEMVVYQFLAFSFCHCKNVQLVPAPISRQVRRRAERIGEPIFEHHNIVIEPLRRVLVREGGLQQHGDVLKAMHICRGHFAQYGEQYGTGKLFGKYEGQFWIPQHVRGKLERGVVTKDYQVKAAQGSAGS